MNAERNSRIPARTQHGFSLIEILIVVALMALIAGMVANQVFGGQDRAKVRMAQAQVTALAGKVSQFEMDTGALPQRLEDLVSASNNTKGWLGPYSRESELKDPWSTPIEYRAPGSSSPFELVSYGADRKPGGSGVNADISSDD